MKHTLIALSILVILTACTGGNSEECYKTVKALYPKAQILSIPGRSFKFIVKDTCGAMYYIETMHINDGNPSLIMDIQPCK